MHKILFMPMYDLQILRAACCIAGLDGEVCERERNFLERLRDKAGVGARSFEAMLDMAKSDPRFYEDQMDIIRRDHEEAIRTLFAVATIDGDFSEKEQKILRFFAGKVGLSDEMYDRIVAEETAKLGSR